MYKELKDLGWKHLNASKVSEILNKEDKVIKIYTQEMKIYDYEPLMEINHLPEIPNLIAYESNHYIMMEYITGVSIKDCSAEAIKNIIPAILAYFDKCCEAGWLPNKVSLHHFVWNQQKGLRVLDFTRYLKVNHMSKSLKEMILKREKESILNQIHEEMERKLSIKYA